MATVLVVEDDPELARLLVRTLVRAGFETTVAPSKTAALACTSSFEVGIFDILLPDGDGVEVADALMSRRQVHFAIFYSGTTDERILLRASQRARFVPKSDGVRRLVDEVRSLISSRDTPTTGLA